MKAETDIYRYSPTYAVPPGETLLETIEALGMSRAELAKRTGLTPDTIDEIIQGRAPMTPEIALRFELVLGVPARFWMNLERRYRAALANPGPTRVIGDAGRNIFSNSLDRLLAAHFL